MGMSDLQFEVYNALLNFVDELIDKEPDEKEREKLCCYLVLFLLFDLVNIC